MRPTAPPAFVQAYQQPPSRHKRQSPDVAQRPYKSCRVFCGCPITGQFLVLGVGLSMERYIIDERTGWKYELVGDYYLPVGTRFEDANPDDGRYNVHASVSRGAVEKENVVAPERPAIGRFGRAHGEYLKRTQRHVYSQFVAEGKLGTHLAQIDEQANAMLELLTRQIAEREGVTEELKATDQMEWVRRMNNIRNRAEEIIHNELIFV